MPPRPFLPTVALTLATLLSLSCNRDDASSPSTPAGGHLSGTATTQAGLPLPSFDVEYSGHVTGQLSGYDANGNLMSSASGTVQGRDGAYRVKLPDGQYSTRASVEVTWQGRPFHFRLDPADGTAESKRFEVTSSNGFVRNYVWKLTGPKPGTDPKYEGSTYASDHYGGIVELDMNVDYRPARNQTVRGLYQSDPDAEIEFTLTPKSRCVDGSDAKPLTEKVPVKRSGTYSGVLRGIPVAEYSVSAQILSPNKPPRPAALSLKGVEFSKDYMTSTVPWQPTVDILFDTPYDGVLRDRGPRPVRVYVGDPSPAPTDAP
jgi:hypothetical protein